MADKKKNRLPTNSSLCMYLSGIYSFFPKLTMYVVKNSIN